MFHKHEWKEVEKQHIIYDTQENYWDKNGCHYYQEKVTIVTFKCKKCSKYKQQELDGHLSLKIEEDC